MDFSEQVPWAKDSMEWCELSIGTEREREQSAVACDS